MSAATPCSVLKGSQKARMKMCGLHSSAGCLFIIGLKKFLSGQREREACLDRATRPKEPQISPLRYAPVEMTNLFGNPKYRFHDELSSRPERSVAEGPAVS